MLTYYRLPCPPNIDPALIECGLVFGDEPLTIAVILVFYFPVFIWRLSIAQLSSWLYDVYCTIDL